LADEKTRAVLFDSHERQGRESGEMAFVRKPVRAGMFVETGIKKFQSSAENVLGSATVPVAV
jgi:hypothetical protein